MVGGTGIEPVTSSASRKHSSTELTAHLVAYFIYGGGTRIWTEDEGFAILCLPTWLCRLIKDKKWSGKRDLNPRPSPWQGDALPLSYFRTILNHGAETQSWTGDTWIFSPLLYRLSYLGRLYLKKNYIRWRGRRDLNPRSPAWQAGVLNRAALRPHIKNNGRRNRAWTCDPWLVKPVLSQLSYPPKLTP